MTINQVPSPKQGEAQWEQSDQNNGAGGVIHKDYISRSEGVALAEPLNQGDEGDEHRYNDGGGTESDHEV